MMPKRLRGMTPGELADEIGALKADAADAERRLDELKQEAIRRKLTEADGALFHIALSPPTVQQRFSLKALIAAKGKAFADRFREEVAIGWALKCTALPRAK